MKNRNSISAALAAALVITSSAAHADSNLGAFAVGAAIGALVNSQVKKERQQKQVTRKSSVSSYQRQQNREVQAALNGFGFPVGGVDGQLGKRSRAAISNYQSFMGYEPTGYLQEYQRANLVGSHQRLQAGGGAAYPEVVANEGTKGLLRAFQDPTYVNRYRTADPGVRTAGYATGDFAGTEPINRFGAAPVAPAPAPAPVAPAVTSFAPLDLSFGPVGSSMASHCDAVTGLTASDRDRVMADIAGNADQALGEQFCEMRAFTMSNSADLLFKLGQTEGEFAVSCTQIADAVAPATSQIGTQSASLVAASARDIANGLFSGDMNTASSYGQICLGVGYSVDDSDMALGAATVMLATGQMPYAEVMGHHMRWGFGTAASPEGASRWYDTALSSLDSGSAPVFLPGKSMERTGVIKAALTAPVSGGADTRAAATGGGLSLPALSLGD